MDDFTNRLIEHVFFEELLRGNPFANAREKSSAAERCERIATSKFDYLKSQMDMALHENTRVVVSLGCHPRSESPLNLLSPELLKYILGFVGMEPTDVDVATGRLGLAIVPFEGWHQCTRTEEAEDIDVDLTDMNLYKPGRKITIPLTAPSHHLTGPCYRDLRKHIRAQQGWDVQRIAATPEQRRQYDEHRKGRVYFINVIYNVQGQPGKRNRQRKANLISWPLSPTQEGKATPTLAAAVQSAGIDGQVDPVCLQRAVVAGYSKHFVLGQAAEYWDAVKDLKPQAKKAKTRV